MTQGWEAEVLNCPDIADNHDNYHYCDIGDNDDDNFHYFDQTLEDEGPFQAPFLVEGRFVLRALMVGNGDGQWASYTHTFTLDGCACVLDAVTNVMHLTDNHLYCNNNVVFLFI